MTTLPPELRAEIERMVQENAGAEALAACAEHRVFSATTLVNLVVIRAAELAVEHAERRTADLLNACWGVIGCVSKEELEIRIALLAKAMQEFSRLNPPTEDAP